MTYRVGQRVRINRADTRTQALTGDYGSIVSQGYNARGATYRVRLERAIDRSPRQTPEAGDYTFTHSQLAPASERGPREFVVGDPIQLRNGSVSLTESGVREPVGTRGVIHRLGAGWATSGSAAAVTVVLDTGETRSLFADQIERPADLPFAVGDRVRFINGPGTHGLAATGISDPEGTFGVITHVPTRPSRSYQVRVEGDTRGWRRGEGRDWDWNVYADQMQAAPAEVREIQIGDRVRLVNGVTHSLTSNYIRDPEGTEGEVTNVNTTGFAGHYYTVRTASNTWSCYQDQVVMLMTPAPAPVAPTREIRVGDTVRLRDGARTLASHYITDPVGTTGTVTEVNTSSYQVQTTSRPSPWNCYRDQVELVETPVPVASPWVPLTDESRVVGARVRYTGDNGTMRSGDEGSIVGVRDRSFYIRMDNARDRRLVDTVGIGASYHWSSTDFMRWQVQAAPVASPWAAATRDNATTGTRIRYNNSRVSGTINLHDEGVIVRGPQAGESALRIRMDSPRGGATLSGDGAEAYHWWVGLGDIEVQTAPPAVTEERWIRLNRRDDALPSGQARVGRRVRYASTSDSGRLRRGDMGTVINRTGSTFQIRMDDPRGQRESDSGAAMYHWQTSGSDFEVSLGETAPAAETYTVTEDGTSTTWTVGSRIEQLGSSTTYRNMVVVPVQAYADQSNDGRVAAYMSSYVFFSYQQSDGATRVTGLNPSQVRVIAPAPPVSAAVAAGVTFTPAQAALIKRTAERFTRSHGFERMANDIMRELGVDQAPDTRTVSLTITVDVPVTMVEADAEFPRLATEMTRWPTSETANAFIRSLFNTNVEPGEINPESINVRPSYGQS